MSTSTAAPLTLAIDGMHCQACVRRVRTALEKLGTSVQEVQIGHAVVDPRGHDTAEIIATLDHAGFPAREGP